jgi:hypothetical protein
MRCPKTGTVFFIGKLDSGINGDSGGFAAAAAPATIVRLKIKTRISMKPV